jgi:hypothetical protein
MDPISSRTSTLSLPTPAVSKPTLSAPEPTERTSVGPLYGARVISDAVEASLDTIQALADMGVGAKVDAQA